MFTNTYLPHVGGVAKSVDAFAREYRKRGHECLVIAPEFEGAEESTEDVVRVPAIRNFHGSGFSVRLPDPIRIDGALHRMRPDIVHSHHPFLLGDTALRVAKGRDLPMVFTHHTLYERYTHYVPFDSELTENLAIRLATEYANMTDQVVAPSASVADLLRRRGVERPIAEIPTGIDLAFQQSGDAAAARRRWNLPENALVAGHVGRLAAEKNLHYLAEAVIRYLRARENARFLLVGDGPARKNLGLRFAEAELDDRVVFTGALRGRDLADAYAAMDCFVFASTSETQGMVLAEAMGSGAPVVALDASGAREVVASGENGVLLPRNAPPEDFAAAVARLHDDPDERGRCRSGAEATARSLTQEVCAGRMLDIYEQRIGHPKERSRRRLTALEFEKIANRLHAEWDLLASKTSALFGAFGRSRDRFGDME